MAKPNPKRLNFPFSLYHRSQFANSISARSSTMFMRNMPQDYLYEIDDFNTSTMDSARWNTGVTAGGAPTAFAYNAQRCAAVRGATGATSAGVSEIYGNTIFDAADNPGMLIRFKAPAAVTSFHMEIGWQNAPTANNVVDISALTAGGVGTAANGLTDGGMFIIDTGYTLATMALNGVGTSTAIAGAGYGSTYTPTASKWITALVIVGAGNIFGHIWDNGVSKGGKYIASGPDAGTLLQPFFLIKTLNTTSKTIDIDYIALFHERNAT